MRQGEQHATKQFTTPRIPAFGQSFVAQQTQ